MACATAGKVFMLCIDTKRVRHNGVCQKGVWGAKALGLPVFEDQNIVTDTNGHVEVVQGHNNCQV